MDLNKYLNNAAPSEPQYSKEEYAAMKKTEREAVWAQVDARMGEVLADAPALQEFLNFMSQCRNSLPNQLLLSGECEIIWATREKTDFMRVYAA